MGVGALNLVILYDNLNMLDPAEECYQFALALGIRFLIRESLNERLAIWDWYI
jgi:hypothetical protein